MFTDVEQDAPVEHAREAAVPMIPSPRPGERAEDEPDDELDVRLHAPTPDTVIVWVAGPLRRSTAYLFALRVRQQFRRASHVILDLSAVTCLDPHAVAHLGILEAEADSLGSHLHIAGAENEAIAGPLGRAELPRPPVSGPADVVLARLASRPAAASEPPGQSSYDPEAGSLDACPALPADDSASADDLIRAALTGAG
jgi:anti-anti-sigma regulatory factor